MEDFPPQEEAYKLLLSKILAIRKEDAEAKFYIYCYTLGKEEVFYNLAVDLETRIQLLKERWHRLSACGICDPELFTLRELQPRAPRNKAEKLAAKDREKIYVFLR